MMRIRPTGNNDRLMTDTIRGTRPKLSINGAARGGGSASVHDIADQRAQRDGLTQAKAGRTGPSATIRGIDLDSVIGPVCSHFGADEAKAAELDAFARKLLGGAARA